MNPILQKLRPSENQNNISQIIQQFSEFKKFMSGKNPQAMVQELLDSGKMSQEQFEQLKQQALELQSLLK